MERWHKVDWIDGYTGSIEVSDFGNVRRSEMTYTKRVTRHGVDFGSTTSTKPARILTGEVKSHGYRTTSIHINKKRVRLLTHRLVARAFVAGYAPHLSVNHINGNKLDNRAENLEWVTLSENTSKQWQTGLVNLRGDANPNRIVSSDQVIEIRRRYAAGEQAMALAREFGLKRDTIYAITSRQRWASV